MYYYDMIMPQEMDVWYLIPAVRKELSRILVEEHNLKQKEVAALLGITNSAVSQYLKAKRGADLSFSEKEVQVIRTYATKMNSDPKNVLQYMVELSAVLKKSGSLCALHKSLDGSVPENCSVCKNIS